MLLAPNYAIEKAWAVGGVFRHVMDCHDKEKALETMLFLSTDWDEDYDPSLLRYRLVCLGSGAVVAHVPDDGPSEPDEEEARLAAGLLGIPYPAA